MNAQSGELDNTSGFMSSLPMRDVLSPIALPCGRVLQNRLVKVSLYEHMATMFGGPPNASHFTLYSRWGSGQWGIVMTGNYQVVNDHLSVGRDVVIPEVLNPQTIEPFARLAAAIHQDPTSTSHTNEYGTAERTLAVMQLSHSGRQSYNILGGRRLFKPPLAPSAVPMDFSRQEGGGLAQSLSNVLSVIVRNLLFQTPRAMSSDDIEELIRAFVRGAQLATRSGFDGIELQAGHGYLLAEFISSKSNLRTDKYGEPLQLLHEIISAIRTPGTVPPDFVIGVKLNAADYVDGDVTTDEERALSHVRTIASWKMVDFIEVSGGTYEDPKFLAPSISSRRQALFSRFSRRVLTDLSEHCGSDRPLVLLTGGLSSSEMLPSALQHKHADLLGVGRLSIVYPELPRLLKDTLQSNGKAPFAIDDTPPAEGSRRDKPTSKWSLKLPKLVNAGDVTARYTVVMHGIVTNTPTDTHDKDAMNHMWAYRAPGPSKPKTPWFTPCAVAFVTVLIAYARSAYSRTRQRAVSLAYGLPIFGALTTPSLLS